MKQKTSGIILVTIGDNIWHPQFPGFMQVLHFDLKQIQNDYLELRYFESNSNDYQRRF